MGPNRFRGMSGFFVGITCEVDNEKEQTTLRIVGRELKDAQIRLVPVRRILTIAFRCMGYRKLLGTLHRETRQW